MTAQHGSIPRVVARTGALGIAAAILVAVLSATVWADAGPLLKTLPGLPLFVALAAAGQLSYVWVRHGATDEELTFFEVVLAAAILVLAPATAFGATLVGMLIGELIIRRAPIKLAFNLGSYAAATGAMIVTYHVLFPPGPNNADLAFTWRSIVALLVAAMVFTAVNTATLASLMRAAMGSEPREFFREEWQLSAFMAISSVGIGAMGVALAANPDTRALVPFVLLPALALWYAYGAAAQHSEARERNRWLVTLGAALARQGQSEGLLSDAGEAIRQIVGAPELEILLPNSSGRTPATTEVLLGSLEAHQDPRPLHSVELPANWASGVIIPLELGSDSRGAVLLGATEPYRRSRIATALPRLDTRRGGRTCARRTRGRRRQRDAGRCRLQRPDRGEAEADRRCRQHLRRHRDDRRLGPGPAVEPDDGRDDRGQRGSAGRRHRRALPDIVRTVIRASRDGQAVSDRTPVDVHLVRADGQEIDVTVSTVRVRESVTSGSADDAGWVSILTVHDETRERRVARMKTDFVATISHELRTPITPIKGYAHLLATRGDRMTTEKRAQALQVISERADHLARLVDDLLAASRGSDAARLDIKLGVEDLAAVMGQAVSGFPQMADRTSVTLPTEPVAVRCDRVRVVQCLSNLLGNIEKYTEPESPVEVWAAVVGPNVQIHVRDHGPGIPADDREKVFERFFRREDPFTMRTGGAGLGLHIARELALAMGGGLTLSSPAEGSGAEFVLHLPLADDDEISESPAPSTPEGMPGYRPDPRLPPGAGSGRLGHPDATLDMPQAHRAAAT